MTVRFCLATGGGHPPRLVRLLERVGDLGRAIEQAVGQATGWLAGQLLTPARWWVTLPTLGASVVAGRGVAGWWRACRHARLAAGARWVNISPPPPSAPPPR